MRLFLQSLLVFCALSTLVLGPLPAFAVCRVCTGNFTCLSTSEGAQMCLAFGQTCTMAGACFASHPDYEGLDDPLMEAITSVTVLDEAPTALGTTGVRLERAVGEELAAGAAARGWAQRTGGAVRPTLIAGLMHGQGIPIAVRMREGDGFVIERRDTRKGIKLVVRSLFAGHPGHVIVSRIVEEGDLVALRANVAGRSRVVLLHVLKLSTTRDSGRIEALQAQVAEAARERRGTKALEFDLVPVSQ